MVRNDIIWMVTIITLNLKVLARALAGNFLGGEGLKISRNYKNGKTGPFTMDYTNINFFQKLAFVLSVKL